MSRDEPQKADSAMPRRTARRFGLGMGIVLLMLLGARWILTIVHRSRFDGPLSGRIIDAESKHPVADAAIHLHRHVSCPRFVHGSDSEWLPVLETTTDANGAFTLPNVSSRATA